MARILPTNYKDDILDMSVNERRKFNMIQNDDGTVSFEDVTQYEVEGTDFGATDINKQNAIINSFSFLAGGFILKDVQINLANKKFFLEDDRITKDTLILVFFKDEVLSDVYKLNILANTVDGGIEFTSEEVRTKNVPCDIYVVGIDESEVTE